MRRIQISDSFTAMTILRFALPSIGMQLVDNTYQVADGYFISNYIGASAFAAENLIFPPLSVVMGLGLMFGSGAAALISRSLGEGDGEKANRQLTLTMGMLAVLGAVVAALLFALMPRIARLVGAPEDLVPYCVEYGRILAACMPFQMLGSAFHPLLVTANRPGLGLWISILNAAVNILLDWVAVALLGWGLRGAALATGLAWVVSATVSLLWFCGRRRPLRFGALRWNGRDLAQTCYNGASEMVDAVSYALIAMLFNGQLLKHAGEHGVAAYAVSEYVGGVFLAVFFGISMSITPVVGYRLGQGNRAELRGLRDSGIRLTALLGLGMAVVSYALSGPIARVFVGYDAALTALSVEALKVIAFAYLLGGVTTFAAAFFTGMNDGTGSLAVAVLRSFAVPLAGLLLLPLWLGRMGIWLVAPLAEAVAAVAVIVVFRRYRKKGIL